MELTDRIAQWEKMTAEAPDGMSWFSLGNAYRDAGRTDDAARALSKAVELDPNLSRAYQLLGQTLIQLGKEDEAANQLTKGYKVAAERGDVMPQKAIGSLLESIGREVPKAAAESETRAASGPDPANLAKDQIIDRRTGHVGTRMAKPPMRGRLGQFIGDHYSAETWGEWIRQGTKVINELRLDFSREDHQRAYDQQMMEWLGISAQEVESHAASSGAR